MYRKLHQCFHHFTSIFILFTKANNLGLTRLSPLLNHNALGFVGEAMTLVAPTNAGKLPCVVVVLV